MSTTVLFVELIVIGIHVSLWLALLLAAILGVPEQLPKALGRLGDFDLADHHPPAGAGVHAGHHR